MFNPFKKKAKRPTENRATHFTGRIFNRYGAPAAQRCGTKNSGLFMELECHDFTVSIRAEHIEGHDYVRVHRIGAAENGIGISELVNVIVDKREDDSPISATTTNDGELHITTNPPQYVEPKDVDTMKEKAKELAGEDGIIREVESGFLVIHPKTDSTPVAPMKIVGSDDIGGRAR
jgi:hypothetical protein